MTSPSFTPKNYAATPSRRVAFLGLGVMGAPQGAAAADLLPDAVISIAPPAAGRGWDFAAIPAPDVPWLVVQGDADEIIDPQAVYAWIDGLARKPQLVRMPDTSHFFHRKLVDLRGAIQHETKAWLPPA